MSTTSLRLPAAAWPRLHLAELGDQPWLPDLLRRGETDYLAAALAVGRPFAPLAVRLGELLDRAGTHRIIDLGSGGAGPWPHLTGAIADARAGRAPEVRLTDLRPNRDAIARAEALGFAYEDVPVDARDVPPHLTGVRTLFDAFHHLRPADGRAVLADAHRACASIVVAEALSRRASALIATLFLVPWLVVLLTPRVRPVTISRLLLTYLVPILPLMIWFDGVVSCLRSYRPRELLALTEGLDGYRWEAGEIRHNGALVTFLVGEPVPKEAP
jgi:hypothetical protein